MTFDNLKPIVSEIVANTEMTRNEILPITTQKLYTWDPM
jgi:hypothetical protein